MLDEETFGLLKQHFRDPGLLDYVREHQAGFRFLVPSLCDHDLHSGNRVIMNRVTARMDEAHP
jgi:hypothetical protein